MLEATCHCGAVRIKVAARPGSLTSCNCSICYRLGALWAYYRRAQLLIVRGEGATVPYAYGERMLAFHHCPTCGCVTHYESLDGRDRTVVNARLMPRAEIEGVPVRRLDGADTWEYLE